MGYYSDEVIGFRSVETKNKTDEFTFITLAKSILNKDVGIEKSIVIDFSPSFPISLYSEYLYKTFVLDYIPIFDEFIKDIGLNSISYINVDFKLDDNDKTNIIKRYKKSLVLSPFNFYKILDSYNNKYINSSLLLNLLHENGTYETEFIINREDIKYLDYYNPLTGEMFHEEFILPLDELCLFYKSFSLNPRGEIIKEEFKKNNSSECINCNRCNSSCPVDIYPQFYYHYLEADFIEEVENLLITKCTSCGICSFVCPTHLPLTGKIISYLNEREV